MKELLTNNVLFKNPDYNNQIRIFFIEPYYIFYWNENTGKVKITSGSRYGKNKEISVRKNMYGYLIAKVDNKQLVIHQFLGEKLFGKKRKGFVVNHIDCNKTNNSKKNLEYVTIGDNVRHAINNGNHPACNPKRSGRYKHGRAIKGRIKTYKHEWYEKKKGTVR